MTGGPDSSPGGSPAAGLAAGLARYFSPVQLAALRAARVGIVGAGGLGSNVAMMLARSGFIHLTLVDPDIVDASNLNRQCYWPEDVGEAKVLALTRRLKALEPGMKVTVHQTAVTPANGRVLFADCPVMVEAVDGAETKAMLYGLFAPEKDLYVTASGMGGTGRCALRVMRPRTNVVAVGDFAVPADGSNPPLAPRVTQAAAMQADAVLAHVLASAF